MPNRKKSNLIFLKKNYIFSIIIKYDIIMQNIVAEVNIIDTKHYNLESKITSSSSSYYFSIKGY